MSKKIAATFTIIVLTVFVTACQPVMPEAPPSEIANPASVHCGEQGGSVDIRTAEDGGQIGYCMFDDGSECEEWAFFRGDCQPGDFPTSMQIANPASVNCADQGGTLEIREDDDGGQVGYCLFEDGSECEEWAFFRDECAPGGQ